MARTIGPYELIRRLAIGGSAEIYLARKAGLLGFEQHYALKVLLPHYREDEERRKMMVDEARLTAQLDHPNIVKVHDLGEDDGELFMVMEYVNGLNLAQVLTRLAADKRKMPIETAVYVTRETCGGLHYAHTRRATDGTHLRLVHRDISPQNVLVGFGGEIKLIDFGVAKAAVGGRLETKTGIIKGKLTYMAPEYAVGSQQDHRSDIFATGLCLYEMLTGEAAYDIDDARELVEAVKHARIQRPSKLRDGVPPGLERILERALEKTPDDRWTSAEEMQKGLTAFLSQYAPEFRKEQLASWIAEVRGPGKPAAEPAEANVDAGDDAKEPATVDIEEPPRLTEMGLPAVEDDEDELESMLATKAHDLNKEGLKPRKKSAPNRLTTLGMPGEDERKVPPAPIDADGDDDNADTSVLGSDTEVPPMLEGDDPDTDPGIQVARDFLDEEELDIATAPTASLDVADIAPERVAAAQASELPTAMDLDVEVIRGDMARRHDAVSRPQIMTQSGFQEFATRPPPLPAEPSSQPPLSAPQTGEMVVPPNVARLPAPVVLAEDSAHAGLPAVIVQDEPPPLLEKRLPGLTPPESETPPVKLSDSATALINRFSTRYEEFSKTESGRKTTDAIIVAVLGSTFVLMLMYIFFFGD